MPSWRWVLAKTSTGKTLSHTAASKPIRWRLCALPSQHLLTCSKSVFEAELQDIVPTVRTTIAGTRIIGRLTAGNRKGLLVPTTTSDQELQHLRNSLPDSVKIQRIEERLSALGNVIVANDHIALIFKRQTLNEVIEYFGQVLRVPTNDNICF